MAKDETPLATELVKLLIMHSSKPVLQLCKTNDSVLKGASGSRHETHMACTAHITNHFT